MDVKEPTLNTMLKSHMKYMSGRQEVLAHNVANLDTPGYRARDLKKLDFKGMVGGASGNLEMTVTSPKHFEGTKPGGAGAVASAADRGAFEDAPTKNNVILEDQMSKISDTGAQYSFSSSMLRKYTQLYRKAAGSNQ